MDAWVGGDTWDGERHSWDSYVLSVRSTERWDRSAPIRYHHEEFHLGEKSRSQPKLRVGVRVALKF